MIPNGFHQKGLFQTVLVGFLIILIGFFTNRYMSLFVGESGNFNLIEPQASILLAAGLLLKWKYIRQIAGFWMLVSLLLVIFAAVSMDRGFLLSNILLCIGLGIILYFLFFSDSLKTYVENARNIDLKPKQS